ncbi:ankyrin protein [Fusarium mundagurra]|uniref:Ankyrin protein n=1 Tax=Fusarium mundagurra TaxID=1567541 RepID=A0A8H5YDF0_9HYPO|nr:ankyrin protein [Fusarium mundagurra]
MLSAILVPRRWRLNTNDNDASSCPGWHKGFTKRLFHFHRHKRNKPYAKDIDAKQPCATTSLNRNDNDRSIHQEVRDKTCNSLVHPFNSSYPRADILSRVGLCLHQNVRRLHRGYLGTLEPALLGPFLTDPVPQLRIGASSDDHRGVTKGGPSQKRPPESPGKCPGGSTGKKQCRGGKNSGKAQNDRGSDDNGEEDKRRKRRKRRKEKDGPRFPWPENSADRKNFECPFYKAQPDRYSPCEGHRHSSISYVNQHIGRCHVLNHVTLADQETGQSADDNPTLLRTTTDPDKIVHYCPRCRIEFHGHGANERCDSHKIAGCEAQTIAQTGVLLPGEFVKLKSAVAAVSGDDEKWEKIWITCFPREPTTAQYNEAIDDGAQPQMPYQGPVNEIRHPNHDPTQVLAPLFPDYTGTQDPNTFLNLFDWDAADNLGSLGYATSDIPNPAPTGFRRSRPGRFDPGLMQPLTTGTQNQTFASGDWTTNNYSGTR